MINSARFLFVVPLAAALSACVPASYIGLTGSGKINERSLCKDPGEWMIVELPDNVELSVSPERADKEIEVRVDFRPRGRGKPAVVHLLSTRAIISTEPGYALIQKAHGPHSFQYDRAAGDKREEVVVNGKSLLETSVNDARIYYTVPVFFGASSEVTLPPFTINGRRVDLPPITLHKRLGSRGICAHG